MFPEKGTEKKTGKPTQKQVTLSFPERFSAPQGQKRIVHRRSHSIHNHGMHGYFDGMGDAEKEENELVSHVGEGIGVDKKQAWGNSVLSAFEGANNTVYGLIDRYLLTPRSTTRLVFQSVIFVAHMTVAFVVLGVWVSIALSQTNRYAADRLIQSSYTLTDNITANYLLNLKGFSKLEAFFSSPVHHPIFAPSDLSSNVRTLPALNESTALLYMQPVPLKKSTLPHATCSIIPATDSNVQNTQFATPMDVASWRACMVQYDLPVNGAFLVDVAQSINSLVPFSSNNFLFLLYITLFLTGILALAFMPPVAADKNNMAVLLALVLLTGNFGFVISIPSMSMKLDGSNTIVYNVLAVPVNNVIVGVILHLVVGLVIFQLSKNNLGLIAADKKWKMHTGSNLLAVFGKQHIFHASNYAGKIYKRNGTGRNKMFQQAVNAWKFNGKLWTMASEEQQASFSSVRHLSLQDGNQDSQGMPIEKRNTKDIIEEASIGSSNFEFPMLHRTVDAFFDVDFIPAMENHLSWITLKYFEYSLTAGLFLIGILLLFRPHADTYMYQIAYVGMFACNIVAIPLHMSIVHACTIRCYMEKIGMVAPEVPTQRGSITKRQMETNALILDVHWHVTYAVVSYLVASFLFFFAGMAPFLDSVREYSNLEGMPAVVQASTFMTLTLFLLFAVLGTYFIYRLLSNLGAGHDQVFKIMQYQNLTFESINNAKWVLAAIICGGGLASIGFF